MPMVRLGDLTIPEAELMAEWADAWLNQLDEHFLEGQLDDSQRWARARTRQLRDMLQASVEGRPTYDEHREREEPARD